MITKTFPTQQTSPLLMNLFLIATIIITVNSLIGMFSRISIAADEIIFLDTLWRVVVGQRVGIDFRNAFGIGPYQLAALLWPWLGPHNYVMWLTIALINLSITFLGCIVAARTLAHKANLAWLFCITLAFELSAPAEYNGATIQVGIAGFYDRHMMSALAILFLQTFGRVPISSKRENAIEVAIPACLLNIMFLTKISGFLLGVMILIAGCLLRGVRHTD